MQNHPPMPSLGACYVLSNVITFFNELLDVIGASFGVATSYLLPFAISLAVMNYGE